MAQKQGISGLIDELRRRRVFRVAAFYGGIAFGVGEIMFYGLATKLLELYQ